MTDDDFVMVGEQIDMILANPFFGRAVEEFERSAAYQFLNTIPPAQSEREEIYYTYNGAKQFLDFLKNLVTEKERILKERSIQQDEQLEDDYSSDYRELGVTG